MDRDTVACRICLGRSNKDLEVLMVSIFDFDVTVLRNSTSISDAFSEILNWKISPDDRLPAYLCLECNSRLEDAYLLRQLALESRKKLEAQLAEQLHETKEIVPIEIVEFKVELCDTLDEEDSGARYEETSTEPDQDSAHYTPVAKVSQRCCYCGCIFQSSKALDVHTKRFHADRRWKCCACSHTVTTKREFQQHLTEHRKRQAGGKKNDNFQCRQCFAVYLSRKELLLHRRLPYRVRRSKKPCKRCCGCSKIFFTDTDLEQHRMEMHLPNRKGNDENTLPIECKLCYKRFRSKVMLENHLHRVKKKKLFECSQCAVTRRTLEELLEHEQTHSTGDVGFRCCGCTMEFASKELLREHTLDRHANNKKQYHHVDAARPFECNICFRSYRTKRDLRGHQRQVYTKKNFQCDICGKAFLTKGSHSIHVSTHLSEKPHTCTRCGKAYKHEKVAQNCARRHERPSAHQCKICKQQFVAASNLKSHMISHSDERRYKCSICDRTFKRDFHLRKHITSHTSERRFSCSYCLLRFATTTEQYKHEIIHTGDYPYECQFCRKSLKTRDNYIKHYERHVEDSGKVHSCHLCSVRYSQEHFLQNHLKYSHKLNTDDNTWRAKFDRRLYPGRRGNGAAPSTVVVNECSTFDSD